MSVTETISRTVKTHFQPSVIPSLEVFPEQSDHQLLWSPHCLNSTPTPQTLVGNYSQQFRLSVLWWHIFLSLVLFNRVALYLHNERIVVYIILGVVGNNVWNSIFNYNFVEVDLENYEFKILMNLLLIFFYRQSGKFMIIHTWFLTVQLSLAKCNN